MITIDQKALIFLKSLLDRKGVPSPPGGIRVGVKAGGCHGLSYFYEICAKPEIHSNPKLDDHITELGLVRIFIDKKSLPILQGTHIAYSTDLVQGPLIFENPNAKSACGCGTSFELKPP